MTPEAQEWADKLLSEYQANLDAALDDFDAKARVALGLSETGAA